MSLSLSSQTRLQLWGPPLLVYLRYFFFRLNSLGDFLYPDLYRYDIVSLLAGYVNWQLAHWIIGLLQERYPGIDRTRYRISFYGLMMPLLVALGTALRTQPLYWLNLDPEGATTFRQYVLTAGIQVFYHCVYLGIYEGLYLFGLWQAMYAEKERLQKAEWQARFDALKSQVNPHFLFNALNALSALIEESPTQAGRFVDELSRVYRYLLQSNERQLTTLESELRFIESYRYLLQTRHGSGLSVQIQVPAHYQPYQLPPLTLQLLLENAVKHNIIQTAKPLWVEISVTPMGQLLIRNNLQRKKSRVLSNGVGLSNIVARYRMLAQSDIIIDETEEDFTVLLPLLTPSEFAAEAGPGNR